MAHYNKEFIEEFIDLIKNEPALWKSKSDALKNKTEKNKAWNNLLEKFKENDKNATIDSVKKKYNGLRACYRRELQKVRRSEKSGASTDDIYVPTLWYFDNLDFLRDQEVQLDGMTSFEETTEMDKEPSAKKIKFDQNVFLKKAVDHLEKSNQKPVKDDADIYGEAWAVTYRKLSETQKIFAKRLIDDALMQGQLNMLTISSAVTDGRPKFMRPIHPNMLRYNHSTPSSPLYHSSSTSPVQSYYPPSSPSSALNTSTIVYQPTSPIQPQSQSSHEFQTQDSGVQIISNELLQRGIQ